MTTCHSGRYLLANARIAAFRVAACPCVSSWCPKAKVHIQGEPTGAAFALKMRPTIAPFARPKSISPTGECAVTRSTVSTYGGSPSNLIRPLTHFLCRGAAHGLAGLCGINLRKGVDAFVVSGLAERPLTDTIS
jgi:hypothetical protein